MSSAFTLDQILALREYEKACLLRENPGLRRELQYFMNYVMRGGRFPRPLPEKDETIDLLRLWITAEKAGWMPEEFNVLAQDTEALKQLLEVRRGLAERKPISCILDCSQPFNVTAFFNDQNWSAWLGPINGDGKSGDPDFDPRTLTLTTVDFAQARFETCLKDSKNSIKGEDKLLLLKQQTNLIRHGGQQFLALWQDYQKNGEKSVLEWLRRTKGITYLDFPGLILRNPNGYRCVLYLYWYSARWDWDYY